jgi:hypothetical protein
MSDSDSAAPDPEAASSSGEARGRAGDRGRPSLVLWLVAVTSGLTLLHVAAGTLAYLVTH